MLLNNLPRVLCRLNSSSSKGVRLLSTHQLVISKKKRDTANITKKPSRPPFMKNIFLGIFDTEMLLYPELDKSSLQELKAQIKPYEEYIKNVDPFVISSLHMIPSEIRENFKNLGLFGQIIPSVYGGSGQTATETALISEITAKDLNVALTLYSHNFLAAQTLVTYGTEHQKTKYLPQLALGEKIAAFCISENISNSDINTITTKLETSDDPDIFILNGKKQWVTDASNSGIFIVLAKFDLLTHTSEVIQVVRLVIVERDSPGVSISSPKDHLGLDASNLCKVSFENTPVHSECVIGGLHQGYEMCIQILNSGRYNIGAITVSILKELLSKATDFVVSRKQSLKPLYECELIHKKCSEIAQCIYILESMTYHTTAILDNYENPDCSLELAIIKIFSFTEGRRCLDLVMELFGGQAYLTSNITQRYFRDFRTMEVFDGTTDIASLFVSLIGLQHAGSKMNETISKLRLPYDYPEFIFKYFFKRRRDVSDNAKLTLKLYEQLHPSLTDAANELEYCVLRLEFAVSIFFKRFGPNVINEQLELSRLADVAVKIYAMTCILARASRSYCIGLRNAEYEVKYATDICSKYKRSIQTELDFLIYGFQAPGECTSKLGSEVLEHRGYFLEHPLERSY